MVLGISCSFPIDTNIIWSASEIIQERGESWADMRSCSGERGILTMLLVFAGE